MRPRGRRHTTASPHWQPRLEARGLTVGRARQWEWPRLAGDFHGTGCTLAAALAARLALGERLEVALGVAQAYVHRTLAEAFSIGAGQRIPQRFQPFIEERSCCKHPWSKQCGACTW